MLPLISILYLIRQTKLTGWQPGLLQVRAKHSGYRSQYLHTTKGCITALHKLDMEDAAWCGRRVAYL